MTTSLGRLVLDMAADAAGFERDMQRISRSSEKELNKVSRQLRFAERDLDQARAKVAGLGGAMAAIGGIAIAGAVREFRKLSQEADRIQKLGLQLGISAEAVQELGFAAEQSGSNLEQFSKGLIQMQRNIQNANDGLSTQVRSFERMGLEVEALRGLAPDRQFALIADALSQMEDETQRNASALEIFGRSASNILPLLNQGAEGIRELREQMSATGAVFSQDAVDAAAKFNDALNVLTLQLSSFRNVLFSDVIGTLADYADFLANTEEGQKLFRQTLEDIGDAAKTVGTIIGVAFVGALGKALVSLVAAEVRVFRLTQQKLALTAAATGATGAITRTSIAVTGLTRAASVLFGPVGIAVAILGTLAFQARNIKESFDDASTGLNDFGDQLERLTARGADAALLPFRDLANEITAEIIRSGQALQSLQQDLADLEGAPEGGFAESARAETIALIEEEEQRLAELKSQLEETRAAMADAAEENENLGESAEATGVNLGTLIGALNEFARDAAFEAIERAEEIVESMAAMNDEIADAAAQLNGPMAQALREFQREAQRVGTAFREGDISQEQAVTRLAQLEEQFNRTSSAIRDDFLASVDDALRRGLPEFVQQMLGLANATERAGNAFGGAFSQIGSNFAQSVINGQSISNSIESALTGFAGQGISESFGELFTDALEGSFEDVFSSEAFRRNSSEGFALAISQAVGGNIGQAAFTAAGNAIGGPIGAVIGSIIGDAIFGGSVPKFQVRGTESDTATDAGTDRFINGPLGNIEFAFRGIEDQAKSQIVRAFTEFDQSIAGIIRDESQLEAVQAALDRFGVSSRSGPDDIEGQLNLRFDAILSTFDSFTQNFVNVADTLDARAQRLADLFAIQNRLLLGQGFGLSGSAADFGGTTPPGNDPGFGGGGGPGFGNLPRIQAEQVRAFTATIESTGDAAAVSNPVLQQTLTLLDELSVGGESLVDTFNRLSTVTESLDRAAGLTGNAFADSREGLVRFGAELVSIFGDDAGAFSGLLNRVLEAAFSEEQLAQQTIDAARQQATNLLTGLGIAVTEETFTQQGLQDLLTNFLGNLGPEATAQLLAAGDAIAALIEAQSSLATEAEEAAEETQGLSDAMTSILQSIAPARLEFLRLTERIDALSESEKNLSVARLAAEVQIQGFIASLRQSIPTLIEQFTGGTEQAARDIQRSVGNLRDAWLGAVDSIRAALDQQLVGNNSSLTNRERLTEIQSQLMDAAAAARGGDLGAAQSIPALFNEAIAQGAQFFGTATDDFASFEAQLRALLEGVADNATIPPEQQTAANTAAIAESSQQVERTAFEQLQLALQLIDQIDLLSQLTGETPSAIGEEFGAPIAELIRTLTGEVPDLTGDALSGFFNDLVAETGAQLDEMAQIEAINRDQLDIQTQIRDVLAGGFSNLAGAFSQFSDVIVEGTGQIGGDVDFGSGLPAFANGGPVDSTGAALVHSGEFVVPSGGALVSRSGEDTALLKRAVSALEQANSDRRSGVELTVAELESLKRMALERERVERGEASRRPSRRRELGA